MKSLFQSLLLLSLLSLIPFQGRSQANSGDVEGVTMLTLTPEEFLKLGVKVEEKKLYFFKEKPIEQMSFTNGREFTIPKEDIDAEKPNFTARYNVATNGISFAENASKGAVQKLGLAPVAPLVITTYRNGKLLSMHWESKDSVMMKFIHKNADSFHKAKSLSSLLPLHTVLKDTKSRNFKEVDVILWYENNKELLALIPNQYKDSKKVIITTSLDSTKTIIEKLSFYDTWREQAGAIVKTNVYPNPIRERKVTIDFTITDQRWVTITLHDVFGRKLLELVHSENFPAGNYQKDVVLQEIATGMYLISVQTDRGEQAIQRILVD